MWFLLASRSWAWDPVVPLLRVSLVLLLIVYKWLLFIICKLLLLCNKEKKIHSFIHVIGSCCILLRKHKHISKWCHILYNPQQQIFVRQLRKPLCARRLGVGWGGVGWGGVRAPGARSNFLDGLSYWFSIWNPCDRTPLVQVRPTLHSKESEKKAVQKLYLKNYHTN